MRTILAVLLLALLCHNAHAADPFYKGKRLAMMINFAAGGPTDIEGRLLARYLTKYIDGQPGVVVQNMDGAGGLMGTNYIGHLAPKDGTVLGYLTGAVWQAANEPERLETDFKTYEFVAYEGGTSVYILRTDVAPGMKTGADIMKAQGLVAGGLEIAQAKDLLIRLALDMLGVEYRYVTGYRSNTNMRLALQNGEINFTSESPPGYLSVIAPDMVKNGTAVPVFYDPGNIGGTLRPAKQLAGLPIPAFQDLYKQVKGGTPSGLLWELYLSILAVNSAMQRLLVFPPGTPPEAITAVRAAILKIAQDQTYAEESLKAVGFMPEYEAGPDVGAQVRAAAAVRPEIRKFLADYVTNARH